MTTLAKVRSQPLENSDYLHKYRFCGDWVCILWNDESQNFPINVSPVHYLSLTSLPRGKFLSHSQKSDILTNCDSVEGD